MRKDSEVGEGNRGRLGRGRWLWIVASAASLLVLGVVVAVVVVPRSVGSPGGVEAPSGAAHPVADPSSEGLIVGPVADLNLTQDYVGRVVVVNYMASWCTACQVEIPGLVNAYDQFRGRGVQLVGIALQTSKADTQAMIRRLGIDYPVYLDANGAAAQQRFHLLGMPTTLVFENGRLVKRFDGEVSGKALSAYLATVTG